MFILSALRVNFFHSPDDQLPQTPRSTVFVDTSFKGKEKHCPNKRMISKWKGKTDILPGKLMDVNHRLYKLFRMTDNRVTLGTKY